MLCSDLRLSLTELETELVFESLILLFQKRFFRWDGGADPIGSAQARTRLPPIASKKNFFETFFNTKIVSAKSEEVYLKWG